MAERRIDRTAWAKEVQRLIAEEADGNRAEFARLIGRGYKTVGRWLDEKVNVSEESVRAIAEALHINALDLLVRIGYYRPTDAPTPLPPAPAQSSDDEALRLIEASDFPPRIKARMKERLAGLRAQRAVAEVEEVRWWLDQVGKG